MTKKNISTWSTRAGIILSIALILLNLVKSIATADYIGPGNRKIQTGVQWQRRYCVMNFNMRGLQWFYGVLPRYIAPSTASCPAGYEFHYGGTGYWACHSWMDWGPLGIEEWDDRYGCLPQSRWFYTKLDWLTYPDQITYANTDELVSCSPGEEACAQMPVYTTYDPAAVDGINDCTDPGENGWCKGTGTIALTGTETIPGETITAIESASGTICSGSSCEYTYPNQGTNSLTYWSVSSFGDTSLQSTSTMKIDSVPPTASIKVSGTAHNGWYKSDSLPLVITGTSSDATSGVNSALIIIDGGAGLASPQNYSTEGHHTAVFSVTDNAGNTTTTDSVSISIDQVAPTFSIHTSGTTHNGWYNQPVILEAVGTDALSGFDHGTYTRKNTDASGTITNSNGTLPLTLNEDGKNEVFGQGYDVAGNTSPTTPTVEYNIDQTKPDISFTISGFSGVVTISGTATDNLSGIESVNFSVDGGENWNPITVASDGSWSTSVDTLSLLSTTRNLIAKAVDVAGNENVYVIVTSFFNKPSSIALTKSWQVTLPGDITITNGDVENKTMTISICDPMGTFECIETSYSAGSFPSNIVWDGLFKGAEAPPGSYTAIVVLEDLIGRTCSDTGTIIIPAPSPTPTPEPTRTEEPTDIVETEIEPTYTIEPTPAPPVINADTKKESIITQWVQAEVKFKQAPFAILIGFIGALGANSLLDPRAKQWERLAKVNEKVNEERKRPQV